MACPGDPVGPDHGSECAKPSGAGSRTLNLQVLESEHIVLIGNLEGIILSRSSAGAASLDVIRKSSNCRKLQGFPRTDKIVRTTMRPEGSSRTGRVVDEMEPGLGPPRRAPPVTSGRCHLES